MNDLSYMDIIFYCRNLISPSNAIINEQKEMHIIIHDHCNYIKNKYNQSVVHFLN